MDRPRAAPRNFFNNNNEEPTDESKENEKERERGRRGDPERSDRGASGKNRRDDTFEAESDLNVAELNRQIEKLERDLTRRDRELVEEKQENERTLDRIKKLERDKLELKREVEDFRDEAMEYKRSLEEYKVRLKRLNQQNIQSDNEDDLNHNEYPTSVKNYELIVQQKNREITQLLEDNEKVEEDKQALQEKLTDLKGSLEEATAQIEAMANDHFNSKAKIEKHEDKIKHLEEENTILQIKHKDLLAFKERHDQYLENLCNAVDIRVDVWKKMMFEKDEEIDRLNVKIAALMSQISNTQIDSEKTVVQQLKKKLMEREEQISNLNEKLVQATEEIESSVKLIEDLQSKLNMTEDTERTDKLFKSLQSKLIKCEAQLEKKMKQLSFAEKEAEEKSQDITSLLSRMHSYEVGEYGLPEAVAEIKELKIQVRIRNTQVESITQEINILHMQVNDLLDENEMLREKLGIKKNIDLNKETKRYSKNRKNEVSALRAKVNEFEEELVQVKSENRSLRKQIAQYQRTPAEKDSVHGVSPLLEDHPEDLVSKNLAANLKFKDEDWKEKYEMILEENTELRKGLQEILDTMQKLSEEGASEVMIQSPVLENLLREMSARGLIHYPYTISSFHLKVCNLEGKNSELREEVHRLRLEEKQCRAEVFEANAKIRMLEDKVISLQSTVDAAEALQQVQVAPRTRVRSRSQSPTKEKRKVSFDDGEIVMRVESPSPSGSTLDRIKDSFQMLHDEATSEKTSSSAVLGMTGRNMILEDLHCEIQNLRTQNEALKVKFAEEKSVLEDQLQTLVAKGNELIDAADDNNGGNNLKNLRKIDFLKAIRDQQNMEISHLVKRIAGVENENLSRVGFLERFKTKALHQISVFQQVLEASVPLHLLHGTKKQLREVSQKYEELTRKEEKIMMEQIGTHKQQSEIASLRTENERLEETVQNCQAKIYGLSTALDAFKKVPDQSQETTLPQPSSPLRRRNSVATLETENLELTQRLEHSTKMNSLLKTQIVELEKSKRDLDDKVTSLMEKYSICHNAEKELREKTSEYIPREEFESVTQQIIIQEEKLVLALDEMTKWKEIAEMAQNQVKAIENIKDFEKMELDLLLQQVSEFQSESNEKAFAAKVQRQILLAEKEKHLAIQQVQKLLSKLSHLEACTLQQDKTHHDREMRLISMHTQMIMRYRSLFSALHESNSIRPPLSRVSQDFAEAFEMFSKAQEKYVEMENQLFEEKVKVDEFQQKCLTLEETLAALREGNDQELAVDSMQRIQDSRIDVARWKRKAEQFERQCVTLRDSVQRLESRASDLEEDRIRLEHSLELKDSVTSNLMADRVSQIQMETLSSTSVPLLTTVSSTSTKFQPLIQRIDVETQTEVKGVSTGSADVTRESEDVLDNISKEKAKLSEMMEALKKQVAELEINLQAKDKVINEFKLIQIPSHHPQTEESVSHSEDVESDTQEAVQVARETINSLQDRLKKKEESIVQYRKLLAEVRAEMSSATERHVQEMRALQLTIHQQQQAFTRMKSTLSQPVKDTLNIEGTIKDQLTRIHELEDEVSELQHALGNVASQLTTARSEAHRWRSTSDARLKELDSARDQLTSHNAEEINTLRQKFQEQQGTIEHLQTQLTSTKSAQSSSLTELVSVLRTELDEKEKQIEVYIKTIQNVKSSARVTEKGHLEERLMNKEKEVEELKEQNKQLLQKISSLQVRISKTKAINFKAGVTTEVEDLRLKIRETLDEKMKIERQLNEFHSNKVEEDEKRRKTVESVARWEESKRWKKNTEKLEARVKELEGENEKLGKSMKNIRTTVTRLEKEKIVLDSRLKAKQNNLRNNSASKASFENLNFTDSSDNSKIKSQSGQVSKLSTEIQDLTELVEKTEFEGKEEVEKLKMEIRCLKERIVTQERQLTAYQIAQKGDPKIVSEIEKMAAQETHHQKEILRLEEDNLHLTLTIEQLRLDTPRLRDRVQHLQKLVEVLKAEKPEIGQSTISKANSQKSLGELERTIQALKQVIEKLQTENKRLKTRPASVKSAPSNERLKTTMESLMTEKRLLMDEVQNLEHERTKYHKLYLEASSTVEDIENRLVEAEKRAKSSEMKLKSFLGDRNVSIHPTSDKTSSSGHEMVYHKMRSMQDELERKNKLLSEAQAALRQAEVSLGKRQK